MAAQDVSVHEIVNVHFVLEMLLCVAIIGSGVTTRRHCLSFVLLVHLQKVSLLLQVLQPLHPLHRLTRTLLLPAELSHEVIGHLLLVLDFAEQVGVVAFSLCCSLLRGS